MWKSLLILTAGLPASALAAPLSQNVDKPLGPIHTKTELAAEPAFDTTPPTPSGQVIAALEGGPGRATSVLYDAPVDGTIWALATRYKARFDAFGAQYTPLFGAHVPRSFPIGFAPPKVTVGGSAVVVQDDAAPVRAGDSLTFDRGALLERYELGLETMEQLFDLPQYPGAGDLTLQIGLDTELSAELTDGGILFGNEWGEVLYTSAIAYDFGGARLELATTLDEGGIRIDVPAAFLAQASYPVTIDPVVSNFVVDGDSDDEFDPDLAHDVSSNRVIVVWEKTISGGDHDIIAELWNNDGTPVPNSRAGIDISSECWRSPSVANNNFADQFFVAAERSQSCGSPWTVRGRTREAVGGAHGSPFLISTNDLTGDKYDPQVGGDPRNVAGTTYCVAWTREFSAIDRDVHARLVTTGSVLVGGGTILIENDSDDQRTPAISKTNGHPGFGNAKWNIVWAVEAAPGDFDIWGRQLRDNGNMPFAEYAIANSTTNEQKPRVSAPLDQAEPRAYMVVYERGDTDHNVRGVVMRTDTVVNSKNLNALDGAPLVMDQRDPVVVTDGCQFVVAYAEEFGPSNYDVYASSFYLAGDEIHVSEARAALELGNANQREPALSAKAGADVASGTDRVFGVWNRTGASASDSDVRGGVYQLISGYGTCIGTNYCGPAVDNSTGNPGVISVTGSAHAGGEPLTLMASGLPTSQFGYFIAGLGSNVIFPVGGSQGRLCLGGATIARIISSAGSTGTEGAFSANIDTTMMPQPSGGPVAIQAGETWNFQCWYRDVNPNTTSNFTDATAVLFL